MKRIDNWSIVHMPSPPYQAPELSLPRLRGLCDGIIIITSPIQRVTPDGTVLTLNSEYEIGDPDPEYEAQYPRARQALLGDLT